MKRAIPIVALTLSVIALFLTLWILVPAPLPVLWLVAVVSSEWSLHVGLFALVGVILGINVFRNRWTWTGAIAVVSGLLALALAAYPLIATLPVASSHAVDLSVSRYSFGSSDIIAPEVQTMEYAYAGGQALYLDAYFPELTNDERPAVVVVHGGSWNGGQRSDFPQWNAWLTTEGFVVFDIDYRLTPQPNWRTATEDVQQAVKWIKARADSFGIDPTRVALMGRSAGGHLALHAAYTAPGNDTTAMNAHVRAVAAFYAPTDLRWGYRHPANPRVNDGPATLRQFTGGTPESVPEVYAQASPIHHVYPATPSTLLIHGEQDQLVRSTHATRLYEKLREASAHHQVLLIPYAQHGFDYNFNGWGAQVTRVVLLQFLNKYLKDAD